MFMNYADFIARTNGTDRLFREFQHKFSKLQTEVRHQRLRERYHGVWTLRDEDTEMNNLEKRIEAIKQIRDSHYVLENALDPSLSSPSPSSSSLSVADKQLLEEMKKTLVDAYEVFRAIDILRCLDSQWEQCAHTYTAKIEEIEEQLRLMIRMKMEQAGDSKEMFRVCERFNKLFVRDKIRAAVWDFQQELITNVEKEIKDLLERYRKRYASIPASALTELRDIPSVSGEVIWMNQLKRQLSILERRVDAVLGKKWQERYNSGQVLAQLISRFAAKLDPRPLIEQWVAEANLLPLFDVESFIFSIEQGTIGGHMSLAVNFDEQYVTLFKEMRRLSSLGIRIHKGTLLAQRALQATRVDVQLTLDCVDVKRRYPISVKLKEAVAMFARTCRQIEECTLQMDDVDALSMMPHLPALVDERKRICQRQFLKGAERRWSTPDRLLSEYVDALAKQVLELQDNTKRALDLTERTNHICWSCNSAVWCPLIWNNTWISCETLCCNWMTSTFLRCKHANTFWRNSPILHVITISSNQKIEIEPPMMESKLNLGQDLQMWLAKIVSLKRPTVYSKEEKDNDKEQGEEETFRSILNAVKIENIIQCYAKIQKVCEVATKYAYSWLSYQGLWDLKLPDIFAALDNNITYWMRLINDMKQGQEALNTTEIEKSFGPIVIQFGTLKAKVSNKFIDFYKQILKMFIARLDKIIRELHASATKGKYELEETSFTVSDVHDIVKAVTVLQKLQKQSSGWQALWEECKEAEKLLQHYRYVLPPTWIRSTQMKGVLDDFFAVLHKRWNALQLNTQAIYAKLDEQIEVIVADVQRTEQRWRIEKPTHGWAKTWTEEEVQDWLRQYHNGTLRFAVEAVKRNSIDGRALHKIATANDMRIFSIVQTKFEVPDTKQQELLVSGLRTLLFTRADIEKKLNEFEVILNRLEETYKDVKSAKDAMCMVMEINVHNNNDSMIDTMTNEREVEIERVLDSIQKELTGLKEVYQILSDKQDELDTIGKQPFLGMDTKALAKMLRQMEEGLMKLPNKIRQYQAYDKFVSLLKHKQKMNKNMFTDLSCGILRPKHWNELDKLLNWSKK
ncbi:dynein heavy chain [Reticulomyxa filosa]|uniref:Dynein heavy chain n=1 Tax=Reticulomyxa filosa TaxID=46433 RepID=X6PB85_RETFI|nr:dynein heavy chain [Reticulomyxa filosa]|eukprot:ETO35334.1 dynein heavy chain [Reticulomyxa filosa]